MALSTLATLVSLGIGIFILPTAVGYWYGRNDQASDQLIEDSEE